MRPTTYHATFSVEVEPETDLVHFQPGSYCATLVGAPGAKAVGGSEREAVELLLRFAMQGLYQRDGRWNGPPRPRIELAAQQPGEGE